MSRFARLLAAGFAATFICASPVLAQGGKNNFDIYLSQPNFNAANDEADDLRHSTSGSDGRGGEKRSCVVPTIATPRAALPAR